MHYNKKRTVFFILVYWHDPRFKKEVGGLIRIFDLADNLKKSGHEVILFSPKLGFPKKQTLARVVEIPFFDFPLIRPISFHLISTLILLIKGMRHPNFLYVRQMNSFLPLLIARLFAVTSFLEIPNDPYLNYQKAGNIKRFIIKAVDRFSILLADRIVVLSHWSKQRLAQMGNIRPSKVMVCPSGTDIDLFRPLEKEECRENLGLDRAFFYVGFIGSFFIYQGIDTLVEAAQLLLKIYGQYRFLLVGGGPMLERWRSEVKSRGLDECFIFTSQVPYRQVPEYIGAMDVCVAPHHKNTNQASPVKLFDYMACARPIVASNIEVVREIVNESGCAVLVPPENSHALANAIDSLREDPAKRKVMGERGREYAVSRFDRKKLVEKFISVSSSYGTKCY